jgi:hypothetical protein
MKRTLKPIDPRSLSIASEAPFRYRYILPGETAGKESAARGNVTRAPGTERETPTPGGADSSDDSALVESIGRFGLIHPPVLIEAPGTGSIVLSGHRRIAAALVAGHRSIDTVSLGEKDPFAEEIVFLWLEEARHGAPLSDLETIVLTKKCRALSGGRFDGFIDMLSKVVGRKLSSAYLERTWGLLGLPKEILDALHGGSVSTGDLLLISESRAIDTAQAAALLARAALPRKEQRRAVRLMLRIGDLGRHSWQEFVRSLGEERQSLLTALSATCHPSLTRDRQRIEEIIRGIGLPTGVTIQPPENLEGGSYRLTARIRSEERFAAVLEKLVDATHNGSISRLLAILKRGEQEQH